MRILHVTAGNMFGGIEQMMATIALERETCPGVEQEFVVCTHGRVADEFEATGAAVHYIELPRARRPWSVISARRDLRQILIDRDISALVAHAPWTYAMFGSAAERLKVPVFFWVHAPLTGKHWLDWWVARKKPRGIVCNSQYTASASSILRRNVPVRVIYCPTRRRSESNNHGSAHAFRRQLGVADEEFLIVQLARIDAWKGHAVLLAALRLLPDDFRWQALIVGAPQSSQEVTLFASLQADAARMGATRRIHFLGHRSDVGAILSAADALCQPNERPEPFGISMVEALLEGVPVIATGLGGAIEILAPDYGILTPPGDAPAIARAIMDLAGNPELKKKLHDRGPGRGADLCNPEQQIKAMCTFMNDVMDSDRS